MIQDSTPIADELLIPLLTETVESFLEVVVPIEPQPVHGLSPQSKYDSFMHAQLCRMKVLGLSNSESARVAGIAPATLTNWLIRFPKLCDDMSRASAMSNAKAAFLLQKMMHGDGPTALAAVKLYLTTHSPEFAEKTRIEIGVSGSRQDIDNIRVGLYGLPQRSDETSPIVVTVEPPESSGITSPDDGSSVTPHLSSSLDFDL